MYSLPYRPKGHNRAYLVHESLVVFLQSFYLLLEALLGQLHGLGGWVVLEV